MNTNFWKILCVLIAALILVPAIAVMVQAKEDDQSPTTYEIRMKDYSKGKPAGVGGGKNKAPSVTITNPLNGATVSGSVTITVEAIDKEEGAKTPTIVIDESTVTTGTSYTWNTAGVADGQHTISAWAADSTGKMGEDTITVTVNNGGGGGSEGDGVVNRYAVIVGINKYQNINNLRYAVNDANDWAGYLTGLHYSINKITDRKATEAKISTAISDMLATADADDICAFIFSGHGDSYGGHCLCTYENTFYNDRGAIYDDEFKQLFAPAVCNVFIFLDSCNAGGMNEVMQNANSNKFYMTTTCGASGYGYDDISTQNGLWTYWFEEAGLEGQFTSNPNTAMETCFDWASADYPKGGADAPCEFDGNNNSPFVL